MDVEREGVKGRVSFSREIEACCESLDDFVVWVCDAGGMSPPAMVEVSAIVDWALIG